MFFYIFVVFQSIKYVVVNINIGNPPLFWLLGLQYTLKSPFTINPSMALFYAVFSIDSMWLIAADTVSISQWKMYGLCFWQCWVSCFMKHLCSRELPHQVFEIFYLRLQVIYQEKIQLIYMLWFLVEYLFLRITFDWIFILMLPLNSWEKSNNYLQLFKNVKRPLRY